MINIDIQTFIDSELTNDITKSYDSRFNKYYETLNKKLEEIGEIIVEGIKTNITSRNYPGGGIDVQRGGIPLYDTGELYNSITKQRINDNEVNVYINGDRSKIGLYQHTGDYNGGIAREFFDVYDSTKDKVNNYLRQIVSDTKY